MEACATADRLRALENRVKKTLEKLTARVKSIPSCGTMDYYMPDVRSPAPAVKDPTYPEYFAYYWGMVDPDLLSTKTPVWCGQPNTSVPYWCTQVAQHRTVFLGKLVVPSDYIQSLQWIAQQKTIENVFIFMNFSYDAATLQWVTEWQKTHNKIKAIYVADEPILNGISRSPTGLNNLVSAVQKLKAIPAFADVKFACCFSGGGVTGAVEPMGVTKFLTAFHQKQADIDWVGFDSYFGGTAPTDLKKAWNVGGTIWDDQGWLETANMLRATVDKLPWQNKPRIFVVPQVMQPAADPLLRANQVASYVWNKLIINWGLTNNAVAIIPFRVFLAKMDSAYVGKLTNPSNPAINFVFLEKTRKNVDSGEGLQKCAEDCDQSIRGESMYPLSLLDCKPPGKICGAFYGATDGVDYCCASTYKKNQGWVKTDPTEQSSLCCVMP